MHTTFGKYLAGAMGEMHAELPAIATQTLLSGYRQVPPE